MKSTCEEARSWVPRALMGDLAAAEEQALNAHLAECAACTGEQRLFIDTLSQVRTLSDSPVPRHFFVYPGARGSSVMEFLRGLTPGWKLASSLAVGTVAAFVLLVAARFQFRAEQGIYSFSFGRPLPVAVPSKDPAVRIEALRVELTGLLEARSRTERAEWMNALRREVKESNRHDTRQQRQWNAALASLEARLNNRIEDGAVALTAGMQQSTNNVFRALQRQRQQDLALTRTRLEHLATQGELKDQETDEILSTLLQVARLPER
ncbi:MAG TPA: zf-HC2 domain-containing protein [Terriglobia bacterium]|nr:zf-HC2 domain-containing protein [Terriglobia bacterium]